MNYIGIDPSLISTAVVINGKIINYCRESKVNLKNGMSKWYRSADPYCEYKFIEYRNFDSYSEGELIKLKDYDKITDQIISDIKSKIDSSKSIVGIEGYNFSSNGSSILDLVTFSTLLRKKIYDQITENIIVVSPMTLKLESCKLTYKPIEVETGKKVKKIKLEYRNNQGISGGKFDKVNMCQVIIDNNHIDDPWFKYIKSMKDDILSTKDIKKPLEDINDAVLIYHLLKFGMIK